MRLDIPTCLALLCIALAGCQTQPRAAPEQAPPDFSLIYCVHVPQGSSHPSYGAVYIVEPCGTFRAATGPGCTINTFPEPSAKLSREQVQHIYSLIHHAGLTDPSNNFDAVNHGAYQHCVIHFDGRRIEHRITYSIRDHIDEKAREIILPKEYQRIEQVYEQLTMLVHAIERGRPDVWPVERN